MRFVSYKVLHFLVAENPYKRSNILVPGSSLIWCKAFDPSFKAFDPSFLVQLPHKIQDCFKSQLKKFAKDSGAGDLMRRVTGQPAALGVDLDRQLQAWKENPSWVDEAPRIKHRRKEINVELKKEAEYFGDIVIVPYMDNYDLVVLKTVAICEYGAQFLAAKYIIKCDDDTFVRVGAVIKEAKKLDGDRSLYVGNMNYYHKPLRNGK